MNFVNYNVVSQFQKVGHSRGGVQQEPGIDCAYGAAPPKPVALCSPSRPLPFKSWHSCSAFPLSVGPSLSVMRPKEFLQVPLPQTLLLQTQHLSTQHWQPGTSAELRQQGGV